MSKEQDELNELNKEAAMETVANTIAKMMAQAGDMSEEETENLALSYREMFQHQAKGPDMKKLAEEARPIGQLTSQGAFDTYSEHITGTGIIKGELFTAINISRLLQYHTHFVVEPGPCVNVFTFDRKIGLLGQDAVAFIELLKKTRPGSLLFNREHEGTDSNAS